MPALKTINIRFGKTVCSRGQCGRNQALQAWNPQESAGVFWGHAGFLQEYALAAENDYLCPSK